MHVASEAPAASAQPQATGCEHQCRRRGGVWRGLPAPWVPAPLFTMPANRHWPCWLSGMHEVHGRSRHVRRVHLGIRPRLRSSRGRARPVRTSRPSAGIPVPMGGSSHPHLSDGRGTPSGGADLFVWLRPGQLASPVATLCVAVVCTMAHEGRGRALHRRPPANGGWRSARPRDNGPLGGEHMGILPRPALCRQLPRAGQRGGQGVVDRGASHWARCSTVASWVHNRFAPHKLRHRRCTPFRGPPAAEVGSCRVKARNAAQ